MKRAGNLWPAVTAWANLVESARMAALGKRARPDVARFLFHLEPRVCALQRELEDGSYAPGPYKTFWISDPKPRLISAAPFRDRVVHHAPDTGARSCVRAAFHPIRRLHRGKASASTRRSIWPEAPAGAIASL